MTTPLDRSSPLPLWAQIASDLRRRLVDGEFTEQFPSDEDLTRQYGVSRQTAREAMRHLTAEGLIVRQRGRGSRVARPVLEQPLHSFYSLASTVRAEGIEERSEVRTAEIRPAIPEIAAKLGIAPGDEVVFVERLRLADAEPIAWDRSWLPATRARGLLEANLSSGGLYELLEAHCGQRVTGGSERIQPVVPNPVEQDLLRLAPRVAAFSIERLALVGDVPLELRRSLIRGDRYALIARWPPGAPAVSGRPDASADSPTQDRP